MVLFEGAGGSARHNAQQHKVLRATQIRMRPAFSRAPEKAADFEVLLEPFEQRRPAPAQAGVPAFLVEAGDLDGGALRLLVSRSSGSSLLPRATTISRNSTW